MYLLAYVPLLWYRVMDKRLLALEHIAGDLDKVNVDPSRRKALYEKYGQSQKLQAA
jgi:alkane 1-monooxygenase